MKSSQKTIVSALKRLSTSTAKNKYKFAKVLHQASLINWANTHYGSFDKMVTAELDDSGNEIYEMLYEFSCMQKKGWFSEGSQLAIIELLGWTRFVLAIQLETDDMPVFQFVAKYKKVAHYKLRKKQEKVPGGDRAYGFSLPEAYANKYDGILIQHGMSIIDGRRRGVRAAMKSFLDSL
jgi:hypothetical protein